MAIEQIHWRISFSLDVYYHVIASTNINVSPNILLKLNSRLCRKFKRIGEGEILPLNAQLTNDLIQPNGLATIYGYPTNERLDFMHVFVQNGRAIDAMNKLVSLLDEKKFPQRHIEPIIKL